MARKQSSEKDMNKTNDLNHKKNHAPHRPPEYNTLMMKINYDKKLIHSTPMLQRILALRIQLTHLNQVGTYAITPERAKRIEQDENTTSRGHHHNTKMAVNISMCMKLSTEITWRRCSSRTRPHTSHKL